MQSLECRVALITGVSRRAGIGHTIAERLASLGADMFLHQTAAHHRASELLVTWLNATNISVNICI